MCEKSFPCNIEKEQILTSAVFYSMEMRYVSACNKNGKCSREQHSRRNVDLIRVYFIDKLIFLIVIIKNDYQLFPKHFCCVENCQYFFILE